MVITIQKLNSAKIEPKYRDATRGNYAHPQNSTDLYQSSRRNRRAIGKRVCCLRGVTIRATNGANKPPKNTTEKRTKTMNINRIMVTVTRVSTDPDNGFTTTETRAVFFVHSASITKSEDYYWNRNLNVEVINPANGESMQFVYKLDSDDSVDIDIV